MAMLKIYQGTRGEDGCVVTVNGAPLDPRTDIRRYSSDSFEWGYEGSGPHQLALAILANHYGDDARAQSSSRLFMEVLIAELKGDEWKLTDEQVGNTFDQVVEVPFDLETLFRKVRGLE